MPNSLRVHLGVSFDGELPVTQFDMVQQVLEALHNAGADVTATVSTVDTPPRTRAARRRTNGAAAAAPEEAKPEPAVEDVAGEGEPDDEGDEDVGLAQSLSPEEQLERGLGITRHLFNAKHKDAITAMRKQLGVTKFTELETKDGPKLLKLAEEWAEKKGMRI